MTLSAGVCQSRRISRIRPGSCITSLRSCMGTAAHWAPVSGAPHSVHRQARSSISLHSLREGYRRLMAITSLQARYMPYIAPLCMQSIEASGMKTVPKVVKLVVFRKICDKIPFNA